MRILLISPYPAPGSNDRSAVAKYSHELSHALASHDEVTVCAGIVGGEPDANENVRVVRTTLIGLGGFANALKTAWREQPDVIHVQHEIYLYGGAATILAFPLFVLLLRRVAPVVVTFHHFIAAKEIDESFKKRHLSHSPAPLVRLGLTYLYRAVRHAASAVIVHHEHFARILKDKYGYPQRCVFVIPHGQAAPLPVTLPRGELRTMFDIPAHARTIFGFFGYIDPRKGVDFLIKEFGSFALEHPDCFLLVSGDPHPRLAGSDAYTRYFHDLQTLAAQFPKSVRWHGHVHGDQLPALHALVDCMVLPYEESAGMSSVLSDIVAHGKPFLISEPLAPFSQRNDGVFALREGSLTQCLKAFVERDAALGNVPVASAEKPLFSWEESARLTSSLYRRVTDRSRTSREIFLLGAYGQSNLGDDILLSACLRAIGPERCTVLTSDPSGTAMHSGVRTVGRTSYARIALAIMRCSKIVVGGGDQMKLLKASSGRNRYSLLAQQWILGTFALLIRKPLFYACIGVGDISLPAARSIARSALGRATHVTLRDRISYEWCRSNIPRTPLTHAADLSFLIDYPPLDTKDSPSIGIAATFQLDDPRAYGNFAQRLAEAADEALVSGRAQSVHLLPFQPTTEGHGDLTVCSDVLDRMRLKRATVVRDDLNQATVHGIYAGMRCVWGARLHSLLLACAMGVPFIAFLYDEKVRHFLKDIGCEQWGIELDDAFSSKAVLELHDKLMAQHAEVRRHLLEQAALLRGRASRGIEPFMGR